ncbi:hypothetical protein [Bacillus cereus]|uniref:hypothetical protein n=1 Tax=Bacillus cereus TaxID=1396 RepID=UPI001649E62A|nr:hypothetical protein [Bacillus cereus]
MSFSLKCTRCGEEQIFKENDSNIGDHVDIQLSCWGGAASLEIECQNPKCKDSIKLQAV